MSSFAWTPHPVLTVPTQAQCRANGEEWTFRMWREREDGIALEKHDPFWHGFKLDTWKDAITAYESADWTVIGILGGGGSGKTRFTSYLGVRELVTRPNIRVLWLHTSRRSSIDIQQEMVYQYLPSEIRPTDEMTVKSRVTAKVRYSIANGFTEGVLVLPNGSKGVFGSYEQDIKNYEGHGWHLILADEDLPLAWLKTLRYRLPRVQGKMVWTFTPIRGITPAFKFMAAGAVTLQHQEAEVLPPGHRVSDLQDWPAGRMPYLRRAVEPKTLIMHWPTKANPWSGYEEQRVVASTAPVEENERRFYGFARSGANTLFPKFCAIHVIEPGKIPRELTRYKVIDPALARNFFITWCGVDKDGRRYITDEWPDFDTYGEWAVPSEEANRFNGSAGPAQQRLGWGIVEYKRLMLEREGARWDREKKAWDLSGWQECERSFIDPRAGAAETLADEEGDSSLIYRFGEDDRDRDGVLIGPALDLEPAMGKDEREGFEAITNLLDFNPAQPLTPYGNEPRLYISSRCVQTIWSLQNYTIRPGQGARDEACKDPVDNQRYLATEDLYYVAKGHRFQSTPRGYTQRGQAPTRRERVRSY